MNDFDLRKYLAENKLVKEKSKFILPTTQDLYAELDKFEDLEDEYSYQPSSQGILAINDFIEFIQDRNLGKDLDKAFDMFTDDEENEFPPSSDTLVDIENFIDFVNTPEGSDEDMDHQDALDKASEEGSTEFMEEQISNKGAQIAVNVNNHVEDLSKRIKRIIYSEMSAQEMSETFKSITFRMGQLLESYATYAQHVQQSNNSDDSLKKIADAEEDIMISLTKIGKI